MPAEALKALGLTGFPDECLESLVVLGLTGNFEKDDLEVRGLTAFGGFGGSSTSSDSKPLSLPSSGLASSSISSPKSLSTCARMGVDGGSFVVIDGSIAKSELLSLDSFVPRRASGLAPERVRG